MILCEEIAAKANDSAENGFKGSVVTNFGFQLYLKPNKNSVPFSKTILFQCLHFFFSNFFTFFFTFFYSTETWTKRNVTSSWENSVPDLPEFSLPLICWLAVSMSNKFPWSSIMTYLQTEKITFTGTLYSVPNINRPFFKDRFAGCQSPFVISPTLERIKICYIEQLWQTRQETENVF